jgi:hypothetical protein
VKGPDTPVVGRQELTSFTLGSRGSAALLIGSPLATDLSAWYAGDRLACALTLAGLAVYGFIVSLGGQSLFGNWLFQYE